MYARQILTDKNKSNKKSFCHARYGVEYLGMVNGKAEVEFGGEVEVFTVHHVLCFDPVRRRMSVIVEDSTGKLFCK